jgi:putative glutamine amidotransferase
MSMPLIGITADFDNSGKTRGRAKPGATIFLPERYCRALERAGGIPVLLSPGGSRSVANRLLDRLDGLVISGGDFDIHPSLYGEKPIRALGEIKEERTEFELNLTRLALKRDLPILGICGGAQALNVALGGTLYQDIPTQLPEAIEHRQSAKKHLGGHRIQIQIGTRLAKIMKRQILEVNTTHHQAVKGLGAGLVVNATAKDGLIEGIESSRHSFAMGVQWHPEALAAKSLHQRILLSVFVDACRAFRRRA